MIGEGWGGWRFSGSISTTSSLSEGCVKGVGVTFLDFGFVRDVVCGMSKGLGFVKWW